MKKETTYQKYKRENQQLKSIVDIDIWKFVLNVDREEHLLRLNYLKQSIKMCLARFRRERQGKKK